MSITELYQRIMQRHVQVNDAMLDLTKLVTDQGHDINALSTMVNDAPIVAPIEQWPIIGKTTALEFAKTEDGLVLRATVEIACHEHTSESAESDFLALHPLATGVRKKLVEWAFTATTSTLPPQSDTMPCAPPAGHASDTVPFVADFAPDAGPPESTTRAVEPAAPKSGVRTKEAPRTCVQWASDDYAWTNYVRSVQAQARDDHPAKKYTAAELEALRVKFRMDPTVIADGMLYQRPGAKFTRWLETQ